MLAGVVVGIEGDARGVCDWDEIVCQSLSEGVEEGRGIFCAECEIVISTVPPVVSDKCRDVYDWLRQWLRGMCTYTQSRLVGGTKVGCESRSLSLAFIPLYPLHSFLGEL